MTKSAPLSMRLDPDVKEALRRLAEKDNRTLTNYVETLIRQHVQLQAATYGWPVPGAKRSN